MGSSSQPAGQTTTTNLPPQYMFPYIGKGLGEAASNLVSGSPQYYPGQQVAGFSKPQQDAMAGIVNLGENGTPALSAAQGFDQTLLEGGGSNPYLDQMFGNAAGATQGQLASEFAGNGRNVSASQALRGEQLDNLATDMYGGNYQATLNDALNAGNQAQSLYGTEMGGLNAAEGVGAQVQNLAQQNIDANMAKYNFYQNLPQTKLLTYLQDIGMVQPGSSTSTPYYTNPAGSALGGALAGAGAGSEFGPYGALIGAGVGALGGYASGSTYSDRRLKTDIQKVGSTDEGTPIYTYRYKGSPQTLMGVLADGAKKRNPGAVKTMPSGYQAVDYSRIQ